MLAQSRLQEFVLVEGRVGSGKGSAVRESTLDSGHHYLVLGNHAATTVVLDTHKFRSCQVVFHCLDARLRSLHLGSHRYHWAAALCLGLGFGVTFCEPLSMQPADPIQHDLLRVG